VGCSGYRWTTNYDQTVELSKEQKVYIIRSNQHLFYELHEAQTTNGGVTGKVNIKEEIKSIPRKKGAVVVYFESQTSIHTEENWFQMTIPYESISEVKRFEFSQETKTYRTVALVLIPVVLFVIIVVELNNADWGGGMSSMGSSN